MSFVGRARWRYKKARKQVAPLRVPFLLQPLHWRSRRTLGRRLRDFGGGADPAATGRELEEDGVHVHVRRAEEEYRRLAPDFAAGSVHPAEGALLFGLVRGLRPNVVVETGTANGVSTAYLLAALRRNGAGRLISIDLPFTSDAGGALQSIVEGTAIDKDDASPVPPGKDPGWVVPDEYRDRWELRLGDARELLPLALEAEGQIDIFFHDSLHTREHMLFEFETAWPFLAPGGVLVSDDVFQRQHDALPAFARSVGRSFSTFGNLGLVRK
jgi:predicted O-methyltransferase YrrM